MIGGFDLELLGSTSQQDVDLFLRAARTLWPGGVLETGDGTLVMPLRKALTRSWPIPCEFFVYENEDAYKSWTDEGLTESNGEQMISVIFEENGIFFVAGEKDSMTHSFESQVADSLRRNRWYALAPDFQTSNAA